MEYRYPIKIFYNYILTAIERDYSVGIKEHLVAIQNGLIKPDIAVIPGIPLKRTPYADLKTRKIFFYESYYGFLWTAIYFLFTAYEKYYIPISNAKFKHEPVSSVPITEELQNAHRLFLWGLSLKDNYSDWPEQILKVDPSNPWHGKITHLWVRAIVFVFYHEYAHLTLNHSYPVNIDMEKEADAFAMELFYSENNGGEPMEIHNILGAVSALTTNLFLVSNIQGIRQDSHPDLDVRIDNLCRKLKFTDPGQEYYFKTFPAFAASIFFRIIGNLDINFGREVKTPNEFWDRCLEQFDKIKIPNNN